MKQIIFWALLCLLPSLSSGQTWAEAPGNIFPQTYPIQTIHDAVTLSDSVTIMGGLATTAPNGMDPGNTTLWQWTEAAGFAPAFGLADFPDDEVWCVLQYDDTTVIVGGEFSSIGGNPYVGCAILKPSGFSSMEIGGNTIEPMPVFSEVRITDLDVWRDTVYASGIFSHKNASGVVTDCEIVKWHPTTGWKPVAATNRLYKTSTISSVQGDTLVAILDGAIHKLSLVTEQWGAVGPSIISFPGPSNAYDIISNNDTVFMVGQSLVHPGGSSSIITYKDGVVASYNTCGAALPNPLRGVDTIGGDIVVSGSYDPSTVNIHRRTGACWSSIGNLFSANPSGVFENKGVLYTYGQIFISYANECGLLTAQYLLQLGDTTCGPLTLPTDSVEVIEEEPLATALAYPNPTTGPVTVDFPMDWEGVQVSAWDMVGRNILPARKIESGESIDLSPQPAGVYLLRIVTADGRNAVKRIQRQ